MQTATAYEPQLRAAVALALAGEPDEAESVVRRLRTVREEDTLLHRAYLPPAEAAVLLAKGSFDAAVEELRKSAPVRDRSCRRTRSEFSSRRSAAEDRSG